MTTLLFSASSLFALSPQIRFDMLKTKLVEQLKAQEYDSALETISELKSLGLPIPSSLDYFEGKALFESGKKYEAYEKLEKYVEKNGKTKYYNKAIAYLVKAEDTYKKEMQKKERERIARKKAAEEEHKKEILLREEAREFSALPQIDKKFKTGQMWTLPVPKKYRDNPFLKVKVYGTAKQAQDYCQNLRIENYNDWRVPTMKELSTIIGKGNRYNHIKWGDTPYYSVWSWGSPEFGKMYKKNQLYPFVNNKNAPRLKDKSLANIMCVRTDSQEKFENYFKHTFQVIKWKDTKIMVEDRYMVSRNKCYFQDPSLTFNDAIDYCKKLTLGGYDDWRVPTEQDMLKRLPCQIAYELYFLRDDPNYNDLWYGEKTLFGQKMGYQKQSVCQIKTVRSASTRHKVRCVRDIGEKTGGAKKDSPGIDVEGR